MIWKNPAQITRNSQIKARGAKSLPRASDLGIAMFTWRAFVVVLFFFPELCTRASRTRCATPSAGRPRVCPTDVFDRTGGRDRYRALIHIHDQWNFTGWFCWNAFSGWCFDWVVTDVWPVQMLTWLSDYSRSVSTYVVALYVKYIIVAWRAHGLLITGRKCRWRLLLNVRESL